jgi:sugar diacid utilization regulator
MDHRELRQQLSSMSSVFALSMVMFDRTDEQEILGLVVSSVAALGPFRAEGAYLTRDRPTPGNGGSPGLWDRLSGLAGADGPVAVPSAAWSWAYPMRALGVHSGYLVVAADDPASADQEYLLTTLAQQAGAALQSAALYRTEREHALALRERGAELAALNEQLGCAVTDLEQRGRIHERLTEVASLGQGEEGIAAALYELTGLAVAIEDRFGNLRAWGGPDRPSPYPRPVARRRAELLADAQRTGHPIRDRDRLVALAQPRDEVLGVIALVDPRKRATQHETFALEHGAVVLAMELAHLRGLAETELRLRRDLVDDLLAGTDDDSALLRATALGHDLGRPHQVLVVRWGGDHDGTLDRAVTQAAARTMGAGPLIVRRPGEVVLVVPLPDPDDARGAEQRWRELYEQVARSMRSADGAIGVGRVCGAPSQLPRSHAEALRALRIRQGSHSPRGVTTFDELGVYRLLGGSDAQGEIAGFVREWLGPLIDYDANNRSDLVTTLWQYYECGGNYDATARVLTIHRSTLRYRLRRIRELSGHDLGDVDSRLNLHLAARAWQVMGGSEH